LLVFHDPGDPVVEIGHARRIYEAAHHPKSFVSLEGAGHLVTRQTDADHVAAVASAWAARYLGIAPRLDSSQAEPGQVLVTETGDGKFRQRIVAGSHQLYADEPTTVGGGDTGPNPYDLLLAGLGACTSMTLRLYAEHKGLQLEPVSVRLRHAKVHAADCADCQSESGRVDVIEREIQLRGELSDQQRKRLLEIADRCPVHRTLRSEVRVRTSLMDREN
jgi:putative redox protein